jgi:ankyrin repeat protein
MSRTNIIGTISLALVGVISTTVMLVGAQVDTRVADAAMVNDAAAVRVLLRDAVDVNSAQGDGMTALHWAALGDNAEIASLLLYAGANVRATTRLGAYTPLFLAARNGHTDITKLLLEAGADPKQAASGGISALMIAASSGDADSVRMLIEAGADVNAAESGRGQTPLIFAAAYDRPDTIRMLLEHGADINLGSKFIEPLETRGRAGQNQQGGQNAQAAQAPQTERQGASAGRTEQQQAESENEKPAGDLTDKEKAKPEFVTKKGGNPKGELTALMYAARDGRANAVHTLVEAGADLDAVNADQSTALLLAAINGQFDIAKYLVDNGADVTITSMDGATPLFAVVNIQWARLTFHPQPTTKFETTHYLDLMKLILDKGADPNARLKKDLWYIAPGGAQKERTNASAITAFWKTAAVGDVDGMRLLIEHGADPSLANITGITPLLTAAGAGYHGNDEVTTPYGRMPAVRYLIEELGADVNEADHEPPPNPDANPNRPQRPAGGFTALHNAASRGDNDMIIYLVSKGARLDAVSKNGQTITDMANGYRQRVQPYPATVALLDLLGAKNTHKCVSC